MRHIVLTNVHISMQNLSRSNSVSPYASKVIPHTIWSVGYALYTGAVSIYYYIHDNNLYNWVEMPSMFILSNKVMIISTPIIFSKVIL